MDYQSRRDDVGDFTTDFIVGAAGAAAFEILKLYEIKHKLASKQHARLLRSGLFWLVVVGMIAASGFVAWAFCAGQPNAFPAKVALMGIAARSLARDGLAAISAKQSIKLGDDGRLSFRELFP
jgi:hypothetical protein